MNMTTDKKTAIQAVVAEQIEALGGQRAAATKAGVSAATISQIVNGKWDLIGDGMWLKIAAALGYSEDGWQLVDNVFNARVLETTLMDAKRHSMMMCVSHKAGSGKTAGSKLFLAKHGRKQVYYIHCREWSVKQFLKQLCRVLGVEQPRGVSTADDLMELVVDFFLVRAGERPLLIVDEADKLHGSALRTFIPLYNATEDRLGIVLCGTENLSEEIKRGVRYNKKGYDEIDSRLGRNFVRLYGITKDDMRAICKANGIASKRKQDDIWTECEPKEIAIQGQFVKMVDDLRRLKRIVQRELILTSSDN